MRDLHFGHIMYCPYWGTGTAIQPTIILSLLFAQRTKVFISFLFAASLLGKLAKFRFGYFHEVPGAA